MEYEYECVYCHNIFKNKANSLIKYTLDSDSCVCCSCDKMLQQLKKDIILKRKNLKGVIFNTILKELI